MNSSHGLHNFLWPQSVGVVGASPDRTRLRGRLVYMLKRLDFPGRIVPITPSHDTVEGLQTVSSVSDLDEPLDLVLLALPAEITLAELERCAKAGVRNAVVITSGFAEDSNRDGMAVQAAMTALAADTGMRICGPNNVGFYNAGGRLAATFSQTLEATEGPDSMRVRGRRTAIVSQSGAVGFGLFGAGRAQGLDVSYVVTTGNEADLTSAEFFDYFAQDDDTDGILLFCESIRHPDTFAAAAQKAIASGKQVVAVKAGRSRAGQRATASHTASMSGSDSVYQAFFAQNGVKQADTLEQAVALMGMASTTRPPRANRVGIVTVSGGLGALVSDGLERAGFEVPAFSAGLQEKLAAAIPSYGSAVNPVDVTASGVTGGALMDSILALEASDEVDTVVVSATLANEASINFDQRILGEVVDRGRKALVIYSCTPPAAPVRRQLAAAGVFVQQDLSLLVNSIRLLAQGLNADVRSAGPSSLEGEPPAPHGESVSEGRALSELESKQLLARHDALDLAEKLATSSSEAREVADRLGYPVAAKVSSASLPHKTDVGGVLLGLHNGKAVEAAYQAIVAAVAERAPDTDIDGVLIQRMAPKGFEFIVGMTRDPGFGPLLMIGAGGTTVELFRDVAYGIGPLGLDQARNMVRSLRSSALLQGFRGGAELGVDSLANMLLRVSEICESMGDGLLELELNPVIVHADGSGVTVVDALATITDAAAEERSWQGAPDAAH